MKTTLFTLLVTFAMLVPTPASADIYINNQQVRGITSLTLENCTVTFNNRGDIYITAPEYKVHPTAALGDQVDKPMPTATNMQKRYFLFTRTTAPGTVPVDFEVLVNGKSVRRFGSDQSQLALELTLYLKPGPNTVAIKTHATSKVPGSSGQSFEIIIGEGGPKAGSLEITEVLFTYKRTASDATLATETFTLDAN
jgi:hypothetical protein